ncbi:mitochondrial import protein mmp37 [Trichophyton equinum CBS 127.97]|uniref:Phosphatidate cytidylyltransferase, mitochondrial n=1 Tax=Trichophyton equinum (strain ATCC MYA-4606 / CBS 127.97) TaxID=559882 RepID=F2PR85_TRIEC|nr:mitochondrial import protein mmp37 [Trichophyton equinum CBS 127.97]
MRQLHVCILSCSLSSLAKSKSVWSAIRRLTFGTEQILRPKLAFACSRPQAIPLTSLALASNSCYVRLLSTEQTSTQLGSNAGPPPGFDINDHRHTPLPSSPSSSSTSSSSDLREPSGSSTPRTEFDWEDNPNFLIKNFSELPSKNFGVNQHMIINEEFKEALRQILWQFKAPIRYAFAYGSGVFPQSGTSGGSCHPSPPQAIQAVQQGGGKMIDFIFGVSHSQHWHSLNLNQHRNHYSSLGSMGSYVVSQVQERMGAGVYFNPYITVNGTLIKYGVVNIDTLCKDLSQWDSLYLAGRLHKPVKILRDHPSVRLANQVNLLSAVRVALLLLPPKFTEQELYRKIAGISYQGDPRMSFGSEDPKKIHNIVSAQITNFRRLYAPLIETLPNVSFNDPQCNNPDWLDNPDINVSLEQDMDPIKRGNMVRRLPKSFREKLYFQYQSRFKIPRGEFELMMEKTADEDPERFHRREGSDFDRRIAAEGNLKDEVTLSIKNTISWPSTSQSMKGVLTAGVSKSMRYLQEKRQKYNASRRSSSESPETSSENKTKSD